MLLLHKVVITTLALIFITHLCKSSQALREEEQRLIKRLLEEQNYDKRIRPSNGTTATGTGPVVVHVNTYVRGFRKIDDINMEYEVQLTFRQDWVDPRLAYQGESGAINYLTLNVADDVWIPDIFFLNEVEAHSHDIMTPNSYVRIFPNGGVLYSKRISLKVSCPMNMKDFPFDTPICSLKMASYSWTTDDIVLLWKDSGPVQVSSQLYLPTLNLNKFATDYCNSKTSTGEYGCLLLELHFSRVFHYYMIHMFVPSVMLVIVSWVSLWLDKTAPTARVLLCLVPMLIFHFVLGKINEVMPAVSYTKAIDVWNGVCMIFIFATVLVFALVHWLQSLANIDDDSDESPKRLWKKCFVFCSKSHRFIDWISRILFPVIFALFTIIYFSVYST